MQKPKFDSLFFADIIFYSSLFILHRAFTFASLNAGLLVGSRRASGFFVGMLSDIWIAGLLALITAGVWKLLLRFRSRPTIGAIRSVWLLAVTLLVASHQSYVEFFGFTMMAFHLRYLYDSAFIMANGRSVFDWPLLAYLGLWIVLLPNSWRIRTHPRYGGRIVIGALVVLVILHNRNIHWRVQWFIPENLQMNMLEKLYEQLRQQKAIDPVRPEERERLATLLGLPAGSYPELLTAAHAKAPPVHPTDAAIRAKWGEAVAAGRKPIFAVMLLESLRPSETGYFSKGSVSLTPHLDRLAEAGVVFTQAYSTGSVTRGGQEAVFCGTISSRDTSLMRFDAVAPIRCLPDVLGDHAVSFWLHGGNGLFDNQLSFWNKHKVGRTLTQDQFEPAYPHTSWGVGDISFLQRSAVVLKTLQSETPAPALAGVMLTVSNHIPWDIPADIIPRPLPLQPRHPSYRTTAYADQAIGTFVATMQAMGLWQNMILVLVSDHGNLLPPYENLYQDATTAAARLQSHVNLVISGGLVEQAVPQGKRLEHLVSQVDIAQWMADVVGLPGFLSMGENLFQAERRLPILARLEQNLFDPARGFLMEPAAWRSRPPEGERELDLLYYRAYIDYISTR